MTMKLTTRNKIISLLKFNKDKMKMSYNKKTSRLVKMRQMCSLLLLLTPKTKTFGRAKRPTRESHHDTWRRIRSEGSKDSKS